jgi:hypothetical protein
MKQKLIDFLNVFQALNKSIVMFLVLLIAIVFTVKGYLSGSNFVDLAKATVVSYFGVTGVVHFTSMVQQHLINKSAANTVAVEDDDDSPTPAANAGATNGS